MFELEIKLLTQAYRDYAVESRYEIENNILNYIESRIVDESDAIKELLKLNNENITYKDLKPINLKKYNKEFSNKFEGLLNSYINSL